MRDKIVRFFRYLVLRERNSYDVDARVKARIYEDSRMSRAGSRKTEQPQTERTGESNE